jgi:16S rRNA (guanine(1405)-N(7))-methyltransferase
LKENNLSSLIGDILSRPKYGSLDESLVRRVGAQELQKQKSYKDALRATRAKLHQVASSYQTKRGDYPALTRELDSLPSILEAEGTRAFCLKMMRHHASTMERIPILKRFYIECLAGIGELHSVLDCACGFTPFALPWMPIDEKTRYFACDVFTDMVLFIQKFFDHFHINGKAWSSDLMGEIPTEKFDLALILKTIPCLEQIQKDAGRRLLEGIDARYFLVSYPITSLGGHEKGMLKNYSRQFDELTADWKGTIKRFEFETELAFLLTRENS